MLNATTTRDIEIHGPTAADYRVIKSDTRVTASPTDRGSVRVTSEHGEVYVEAEAVEMDIRPVTARVYFAVPGHYTIGREFDTWAEATEAATAEIAPLNLADYNDGEEQFSRSFVDIRMKDETGDRPLQRFEVLRTGEVKPY